ncbi:MAG TPA: YceI family protein [Vicinamibacterales bacterium]
MPATATPETTRTAWAIDPAHSHVEFAVKHLMISTVKGRFADVAGTVTSSDDTFRDATVDITIGVASIDTRQSDRDAHLRSADFFEVEKYPSMTFRSTRVEKDGDDLRVTGQLTIRDVSREVVLKVTPEGTGGDPWGGQRAGFSATTKINRKDFGLTWNQALETGGFVVGDEVKISLDVELVKQK